MSEEKRTVWLASLKPGDMVVVDFVHADDEIAIVSRVTKTAIFAGVPHSAVRRFRRGDGFASGTNFSRAMIRPPDLAAVKKIAAKAAQRMAERIARATYHPDDWIQIGRALIAADFVKPGGWSALIRPIGILNEMEKEGGAHGG